MNVVGQTLSTIGSRMSVDNEIISNSVTDYVFEGSKIKRGFLFPQGLACLDDGRLVVADTNNRRLLVIGKNGDSMSTLDLSPLESKPDDRFYPTAVAPVRGSLIMVFSPGRPVAIVDVDRPWRRAFLSLPSGLSCEGAPVWAETGEGLSFRHFNASQGLISLYEIDPAAIAGQPEPVTMEKRMGALAQWRSFLLDQAPGAQGVHMGAFLKESIEEAEKAAQTLAETERKLLESTVGHMTNSRELQKSSQQGLTVKKVASDYSWSRAQMLSLIQKRQNSICALAATVAGAAAVLKKTGLEGKLSAEGAKIKEVLRNELNLRIADYDGVKASLKKSVGEGAMPTDESCVMAMMSLVMLADHIDYLRKSLSMIPGPEKAWTGSTILPFPLSRSRVGLMELFTCPLITLGAALAYWDAGMDGVKLIAAAVGEMDANARLASLKHAYLLIYESCEYQAAKSLARAIAGETKSSADRKAAEKALARGWGGDILAAGMRLAGEEEMARRLIAAAIEENVDTPQLAISVKEGKILDKGPKRLALKKGDTASTLAGARIQYVDTIKLSHPADGFGLKPFTFCVTGASHAAIYDFTRQTIYRLDVGSKIISALHDEPVKLTSLAAMPDGGLLFCQSPDHSKPATGGKLKTLDPKTGEVRDFAQAPGCPGPESVVSACYDVDGVLWALDGDNGKLWWISADLSTSGRYELPAERFNRFCVREGRAAISSSFGERVFRMDAGGRNGVALDGEFIVRPYAVTLCPNAVLLVSTSLGLSVYDGPGEFAGQISALLDGELEYPLTQLYSISYGDDFAGGNLIVADFMNSALHILQVR
jgi:sugar lactone lactonase YvrE